MKITRTTTVEFDSFKQAKATREDIKSFNRSLAKKITLTAVNNTVTLHTSSLSAARELVATVVRRGLMKSSEVPK